MVVYPVGEEVFQTTPERMAQTVEGLMNLLCSPLNSSIQYHQMTLNGGWVNFRIEQKRINEWMPPVFRDYCTTPNLWRWGINNYHSENPIPNIECPVCRNYSFRREYRGERRLYITCEDCIDTGHPAGHWNHPDDIFLAIELRDNPYEMDLEGKIEWAIEGF